MPPRKRPAAPLTNTGVAAKRARPQSSLAAGSARGGARIKPDPDAVHSSLSQSKAAVAAKEEQQLRARFMALFGDPRYKAQGLSNKILKSEFGEEGVKSLVEVVNELLEESKLTMSRMGDELFYKLVADDLATRFNGLDEGALLLYQTIEQAGNLGIWTKDMKKQTNLHMQTITKIIKTLENRKLIKPVKSVNSKNKNLYMLYNITPAEEITGGPWYTDQQFDHEFIKGLRKFILMCVKRLNGGKGVSLAQISNKMKQANVSKVPLGLDKVQQLVQTLAFDYMIEQSGVSQNGEALFVAAKKVTLMCDFKSWEVLAPDFEFRGIAFEDGVTLSAHEPHHHS